MIETTNFNLRDVVGFDENLWNSIFLELQILTKHNFSCFFDNYIMRNQNLFNQFAYILGNQFEYMKENEAVFKNTSYEYQVGGWTNGEISQKQGIGEYTNPKAFGKDPLQTATLTNDMKNFLLAYGLISRLVCGRRCRPRCKPGKVVNGCNCCETMCIGGTAVKS